MSQRNVDDDLDWDYAPQNLEEWRRTYRNKEEYDAERAVIEAAKAWLHEQIHDPNSVRNITCQYTKGALVLTLAVGALEEVERG